MKEMIGSEIGFSFRMMKVGAFENLILDR